MRPLHLFIETSRPSLPTVSSAHCRALKSSLIADTYTSNNFIHRYLKCSHFSDALKVFDEMPRRDSASWNTVISGYVNADDPSNAWGVVKSMKRLGFPLDAYTFGSVLKGIASGGSVVCGQQLHSDIVKLGFTDNVYSASALVDMYAKFFMVEEADRVFGNMKHRNSVSWNALIGAYVGFGDLRSCIELFVSMEREGVRGDGGTFAPLLTLLVEVDDDYQLMRQFHGKITKNGLEYENTVLNATIVAYADCGCIRDSKKVFDGSNGYRDIVTWNSMIAAYLERDLERDAFDTFVEMIRRKIDTDAYTYSSILSSALVGDARNPRLGASLHGLVMKMGYEKVTPIANAMMSMYVKSDGDDYMVDALRVFRYTPSKDHISWNTILNGLSQNGLSEEALKLFHQMHNDHVPIDQFAFSAALKSCSDLATLHLGKQIHALALQSGLQEKEYVASALIFMYSKCGIVEDSCKSFEESRKLSSVTWNSIIFAYAQHGQGKTALNFFTLMMDEQVSPDHITFVAVTNACSHAGLVDDGLKYLKSMKTMYSIEPRPENYACTIDLLGRAGDLNRAKEVIKEMPFKPDAMVLKTLLASCRSCGDIESAMEVGNQLLELDPGDHCIYVILSDMYGNLKRWDERAVMKRLMKNEGIKKVPGLSWIEVKNKVHGFNADDRSHPQSTDIHEALRGLLFEIRVSDDEMGISFDDQDLTL
ncbi:hypothetical protein M569_12404 [Genlisea aurea]|uniref:Pentatricopeptide repeat-containing protein n=1 Tax=Genlisea aurea TaxID=192259 RepID=S8CD78_9LAMI|nr:hypothetical protein M569_12404 [Genlisea aurea]